jgi:arylsulfatase A-like enzyme
MNILFLYTDEQRTDTLRCYGNPVGIMPNVDRLAAESIVFERAYCTQPVCTPSRGSLLTGLYAHAHGATENNRPLHRHIRCLPEWLPAGRHATGHFGKWHLGDEIFPQHGFTDWRGTEDTYHAGYSPPVAEFGPERSHYHHWLVQRGVRPLDLRERNPALQWHPAYANRFFRDQIHRLPEEVSRPAFLADQAVEFIATHRAQPWILYVNFLEPHPPFHSCRDNQYSPADVTLSPNWRERLGPDRPAPLRRRAETERPDEATLRATTARYWGMCSLVDTHVGRILRALDEHGLRDDTILVFTSDHGEMLGGYGLFGKSCMLEESARVPLLLRLPGQRQQRRVTAPVSQVDLVPTLLELLGQPVGANLHGASLLAGATPAPPRDVFLRWTKGEAVRTIVSADNWKFNRHAAGQHELYDLNTDPHERRNLNADPSQQARIAELDARLRRWQAQVQDVT